MSNDANLYNTSFLTSDPYLLSEKSQQPGNDYLIIANAAYKIPVPWLLCFRPEDMQLVKIPMDEDDEDQGFIEARMPCTTVERALQKMEQSLPVFEAITGETKMAAMFWQMAVSCLKSLPLPYLALNAFEVMFMDEPEPYEEAILAALGDDEAAIENMKELSCYDDSVKPFPPDVLYGASTMDRDDARLQNCVALDVSYGSSWIQPRGTEKRPKLPLPANSIAAPNLKSVMDEVTKLAKEKAGTARTSLTILPQQSAEHTQLKMLISAATDAECTALLQDTGFREQLDGTLLLQLQQVCREYGFEWLGYVVRSEESVKKRFTGDYAIYNDWIGMPVVSAGRG